jgi:hypothetical protein
MVMARLHVICGNCGCNDMFEWSYNPEADDCGDGTFNPGITLTCNNCSTIHDLSDNAKPSNDQIISQRLGFDVALRMK